MAISVGVFSLPKLTWLFMCSARRGATGVSADKFRPFHRVRRVGGENNRRETVDKARGEVREGGHFDLQACRIERWIRYRPPYRVELRGNPASER